MRNILFITADQFRADCLGSAGVFNVRTPNLDALVEEGASFSNAYCSYPMCVPARASLMNGLYNCDNGVYYNDQGWDDTLRTLPGELSANGYHSVAVGKMHFRPDRKYYGFDKRCADSGTDYQLYLQRNGIEKDGPQNELERKYYTFKTRPTTVPLEHYLPVYITDRAISELDLITSRRDCQPGGNEPFFMWHSFLLPHTPCDPPEPYFSMYDPNDIPPPVRDEKELASFSPEVKRWHEGWHFMDDEWVRKMRAQYLACCTLVDDQIGRVINHLKKLDIYDNTLIVFSSDHGDYMGDHSMMQKAFFHDCSARVPLVFRGPDIPSGQVIEENVSHIDLMETLLDYTDLKMKHKDDVGGKKIVLGEEQGDGVSMLSAFDGTGLDPERVVVSESGIHGLSVMLKHRDMKYVYYYDSESFDYFNLTEDPDELNNLGAGVTRDSLPPPVSEMLASVLERAGKHRDQSYYFKGKIRPMFT
jgi:arylsulfatase